MPTIRRGQELFLRIVNTGAWTELSIPAHAREHYFARIGRKFQAAGITEATTQPFGELTVCGAGAGQARAHSLQGRRTGDAEVANVARVVRKPSA